MAADNIGAVKIYGYLEKKGKMKVMTTWKKYWFVLEGRLLLYYRSQEEYKNLSPCKGSINMGLATSIQPGIAAAGVFQIITRTNTITLRAKERSIQEKWLQALLDASGQQTASNPIRMSHFRYSMDDLIPAGAKLPHLQHNHQQNHHQDNARTLTRQNTLPHRFRNSQIDRHTSIIKRIRQIGGQTYGGSLDTINQLSRTKLQKKPSEEGDPNTKMTDDKSLTETDDSNSEPEVLLKNDLYAAVLTNSAEESGVLVENAQYISAEKSTRSSDPGKDFDHNKNCYLIENDQYVKSELDETSESSATRPDDIEYYCTYEEVNALKARSSFQPQNSFHFQNSYSQNIYHEPIYARPEERKSESDDCACSKDDKKLSTFVAKFAKRLKSLKVGKKKVNSENYAEPIYDTVDYLEISKAEAKSKKKPENAASENLVKTLLDLQQKLEARKSRIQEMIKTSSPSPSVTEENEKEARENVESEVEEQRKDTSQPEEDCQTPPGLPPRRGSRPRSPFHDVPKNNTPITKTTTIQNNNDTNTDYSIDKILNDLEMESKKSDNRQSEELTVRQLIEKFNQTAVSGNEEFNQQQQLVLTAENVNDVFLRQKCESGNKDNTEEVVANLMMNRHSDELNKLLEELTKVTSAPLLTPGVTSSLVQMKSPPLTDEEWLAITPIRRRRHSEPDYDVPRPHRSLQILPRSPDKDGEAGDTVIPATRFFGPVLPPSITNRNSDQSMSWNSMTPDSLEPLQILEAALKQQRRSESGYDKNSECSFEYGDKVIPGSGAVKSELKSAEEKKVEVKLLGCEEVNGCKSEENDGLKSVEGEKEIQVKVKSGDSYLDSLEPLNEGATAF